MNKLESYKSWIKSLIYGEMKPLEYIALVLADEYGYKGKDMLNEYSIIDALELSYTNMTSLYEVEYARLYKEFENDPSVHSIDLVELEIAYSKFKIMISTYEDIIGKEKGVK